MAESKKSLDSLRAAGINPAAGKFITTGFREIRECKLSLSERKDLQVRLSPFVQAEDKKFLSFFKELEKIITRYWDQRKVRVGISGGNLKKEKDRLEDLESRARGFIDSFVSQPGFTLYPVGSGPHLLLALRKMADGVEMLEEGRAMLENAIKMSTPSGFPRKKTEVYKLAEELKAPYSDLTGYDPNAPGKAGKGRYRKFVYEILAFLEHPEVEYLSMRQYIP